MKKKEYDNLVGNRYDMVVVVRPWRSGKNGRQYLCRCDCGVFKPYYASTLGRGLVKSCGCKKPKYKGLSNNSGQNRAIYDIWHVIMRRCYDKKYRWYPHYGGRKVKVSKEWRDYLGFYADVAPGWFAGAALVRKDKDGPFGPHNCRWVARSDLTKNRRNSLYVMIDGGRVPLQQAVEKYGAISYEVARQRIKRGWDPVKAVTTPPLLLPVGQRGSRLPSTATSIGATNESGDDPRRESGSLPEAEGIRI